MSTPEITAAAQEKTLEFLAAAVEAMGGKPRPGQQQMAKAVTKALVTERHLAVQAGTGTGKSLAYLVPAILHAAEEGEAIVVSTATIALQRQLVGRDLPRLAESLEPLLGHRPTFAIMKGRSNYLCLNKFSHTEEDNELLSPAELGWMGKEVARVAEWAQETDTGDRDDLDPGVDDRVWANVSVSAQECMGATRCPFGEECFAERARQEARDADILVTNHALLAIDALSDANILPEHSVVIIDEAHELDSRITNVASATVSAGSLSLLARCAGKLGAEGKEDTLLELADDLALINDRDRKERIEELPENERTLYTAIKDACWSLKERIGRAPDGEAANDPEKSTERRNVAQGLGDAHDAIVRMLEVLDEPDQAKRLDVVWVSGGVLYVAPLSIAGLLRSRLFEENTVILASATLTIGGNFNAMAASWGLVPGTYDTLDAGTPFNPARSGILYVPAHLPEPGRDGLQQETIDEMVDLIMAAGGRTLGLFSSRRAAEEAAVALRARVPFDVYLQGEETITTLVSRFQKNENSILLGTLTLWQGVDVPGSSCSLVIIDRIPFPRPDDPLMQARKEAADARGTSGFMAVSATHAALLMAQGAGRLLRSVDDKGVVAVLDTRLITKRYGSFFTKSMPAFWFTKDKGTVIPALKRLVAAATNNNEKP